MFLSSDVFITMKNESDLSLVSLSKQVFLIFYVLESTDDYTLFSSCFNIIKWVLVNITQNRIALNATEA